MLIFGHKLIEKPEFCWLTRAEFKQNAVNCFIYDESLIQKAQKAGVEFGILAQNADEILLANALSAKFILIDGADFLNSANPNAKNQALKNAKISAKNATKKSEFLAQNSSTNLAKKIQKPSQILAQKSSRISTKKLAKKASKMAEFYLFDSKILLITISLEKLDKAYKMGVDGVILKELLQEIPNKK